MERESPERSSPDPPQRLTTGTTLLNVHNSEQHTPDHRSNNSLMSVVVAQGHVPNMPGPVGGVNKRYRPAPAKTFQCRGYGDCRMVFSRSEHLARHIRYQVLQKKKKDLSRLTPFLFIESTLANVRSHATAGSNSLALTTCVSMHRPFMQTNRTKMSE